MNWPMSRSFFLDQEHVLTRSWSASNRRTVFNFPGRRLASPHTRQHCHQPYSIAQHKFGSADKADLKPLKRETRKQSSDTDTRMLRACLSFLMCAQTRVPCIIRFVFYRIRLLCTWHPPPKRPQLTVNVCSQNLPHPCSHQGRKNPTRRQ